MWKRQLVVSALLLSCHRGSAPPGHPPEPSSAELAGAAAPAARLPDDVVPLAYALELEIAPVQPGFRGNVRIDVELSAPRDTLLLHADGLTLERAVVVPPGAAGALPASARSVGPNGLVALDLGQPIGPGPASVQLDFSGAFDKHLRGLYQLESGGSAYAFTQFEAIDARQAFPCFDEPRFKTPFDITLRVPTGLTAISNTQTRTTTELPSGQTQHVFARTEKLPTYLVAFAVGPLDVVSAPDIPAGAAPRAPLPLRGVAARGRGPELSFALAETPALLASLERYFGVAYPYDKLDMIAVPDFAAGAMENAGAITFRDTLLLLGSDAPEQQRRRSVMVNAHELAHQWFGNLVTMPWWDDIWLNEGFATWLAGRAVREVHPEHHVELTRVAVLDRAFDTDSKESARQVRQPIATDHDIRNAFDAITYIKGSALLEMFERFLGAEAFRAGLVRYLERHRFGTATSRDLLAALEESSGKPVASAFSTFLDQPGVPRVEAELACAPGAAPKLRLSQRRYVPLGSGLAPEGRWQVPVCVRHGVGERTHEVCTLLDTPEGEVALDTGECPDWVFPNAHAAGYYRWALDDAAFTRLVERGYSRLEPSEQLSLLSNTEAAARAGGATLDQLMRVALQVGKAPERELVQAALEVLLDVREALVTDAELGAYRRLVGELVAARQQALGLFPAAEEDGEAKLLRPALVSALAFEANDPGLRGELERLGRAKLGVGQDARLPDLPSELHEVALAVAVQEGGRPVLDRASAALQASSDGIERAQLLTALGSNRDPALTPSVLSLSLSDSLRTNERLALPFGQLRQRETREAAYAWLEQRLEPLLARLGRELGAQITFAAGAFCSETHAERARRFFSPRVEALAGGPRLLQLSLEAARHCAAFSRAHAESARLYFSSGS